MTILDEDDEELLPEGFRKRQEKLREAAERALEDMPLEELSALDQQTVGMVEQYPDRHERRIAVMTTILIAMEDGIDEHPNSEQIVEELSNAATDMDVEAFEKTLLSLFPIDRKRIH